MKPILVIATNKGGEGKTTFSVNFAEYFSKVKKLKALVIDLDEQANLSSRFLQMDIDSGYKEGKMPPIHPEYDPNEDEGWSGISSIADIFYGEDIVPYPTAIEGLEIIPSLSSKLNEVEKFKKDEANDKIHSMFRKFVRMPALHDAYDIIIIDTPPSKGNLTRAAIKVATHMLVPAQMEKFSMEGIYGMLQLWKAESYERDPNDPLELVGIVANQYRNVKLHKSFYESLKANKLVSKYTLPGKIHERTVYSEVIANEVNPKSIFDLPDSTKAKQEFLELCKIIYHKIFAKSDTQVEKV